MKPQRIFGVLSLALVFALVVATWVGMILFLGFPPASP